MRGERSGERALPRSAFPLEPGGKSAEWRQMDAEERLRADWGRLRLLFGSEVSVGLDWLGKTPLRLANGRKTPFLCKCSRAPGERFKKK